MRKRFRLKLFLIMILFAAAMAFIIAIVDHQRITNLTIEENEFQVDQTQDTITYTLQTIDKVYYYFDQETALQMEENSKYLADLYEENPSFESWDFEALSKEIGMNIYIINEDLVIVASNVESDIGLDFKSCCSKLVPVLEERRESGGFYHDGMDIEQSTGSVKKFSYMATQDHQYLIELGYSLEDGPIFQKFSIFQVVEDLIDDYPMIYDINVLTLGGYSLGKSTDEWKLSPERREAFEETLKTGKVTELDSEWQGNPAIYRYFPYESEYDEGKVTQKKVIELVYRGDQLEEVMKNNRQIFIFQLLFILVLTTFLASIISAWMSRPMYLAFHDSLTGLKNRSGFKEDLESILKKSKRSTSVYMVDLDHFKLVNDHLGHDRGDRLLKRSARVLKATVPRNAAVYRMGGDEFSVIVPDITKEKAEDIAASMITNLKQAFEHEGDLCSLGVSASVGYVLAPEHGTDVDELYKKADIALYKSKKSGRNQYHRYKSEYDK